MRVINQARDNSVEFVNVGIYVIDSVIFAKTNGESIVLGVYGSEERAKELFADINNTYAASPGNNIYMMPEK